MPLIGFVNINPRRKISTRIKASAYPETHILAVGLMEVAERGKIFLAVAGSNYPSLQSRPGEEATTHLLAFVVFSTTDYTIVTLSTYSRNIRGLDSIALSTIHSRRIFYIDSDH